jgi:hypothetical protein
MVPGTSCSGEEGEMPRRPVPVGETKGEKFERLANLRANQVLDWLRKLGSLFETKSLRFYGRRGSADLCYYRGGDGGR